MSSTTVTTPNELEIRVTQTLEFELEKIAA
jgi:hypothetical protein